MAYSYERDKTIIKFNLPSMKADVRCKVFEYHEFHVHSALLKIHSGFFRKFLDSPEKIVPASNEFRYEWVSKFDKDGDWHLVAAQSASGPVCTCFHFLVSACNYADSILQATPGFNHTFERMAFEHLICAIYNSPYLINTIYELRRLTELAEYYLCRQSVSNSIDRGLIGSDLGNYMLVHGSCETAELAIRLRHEGLLKASLIMIQNPWIETSDFHHELRNEKAQEAAFKLSGRLQARMGRTTMHLLYELSNMARLNPQVHQEMWAFMQQAATQSSITVENSEGPNLPCGAKYYRLLERFTATDGSQPFQTLIQRSGLTNNDMELFPLFTSGVPGDEDKFYCGEIPEEDLPWDTNDLDW